MERGNGRSDEGDNERKTKGTEGRNELDEGGNERRMRRDQKGMK